ncbi:CDP-alcohol phosphatidyltransferase family protein [Isosphaeraceae bacterium EP7]
MTGYPTLGQLRARVQKGRHREIGNWLARRVARPAAIYGTWGAIRLGLSANQVTAASLASALAGCGAIGTGSEPGFLIGVALLHLAFWLDHVDGQVARWRGTAGLDGVYLDYLMHHAQTLALGFALGQGVAMRTGNPTWSAAGFSLALGWAMLSLHNDCRYKAFFQRLKSSSARYRVDGGSGGRPAPPAPWPRQGLGVLTWPLFKACEAHVVLVALTLLALLNLVAPAIWDHATRLGVMAFAVIAPILAAGRIVRSARGNSVEAEFNRWFRPDSGR